MRAVDRNVIERRNGSRLTVVRISVAGLADRSNFDLVRLARSNALDYAGRLLSVDFDRLR